MVITKDEFSEWVKKWGWLQFNEQLVPSGRQCIYLTPAGGLTAIIFDLNGNVIGATPLGPLPATPIKIPSLDLRGGSRPIL